MMAQAYEGIYYLENKGNGIFKETPLVKFPPVYGVSYFEMVDVNKDGYLDIVMTNGDNWDLSRVKKRFHGVRILINDKLNHFKESFFFPMYGASKAVARDFDGDGWIAKWKTKNPMAFCFFLLFSLLWHCIVSLKI